MSEFRTFFKAPKEAQQPRASLRRTSTLKAGTKRMRPRRKAGPTKAESDHMGRVARLGCALCFRLGLGRTPAEVHHVRTGTGAGRASHTDTMGLCFFHHRGPEGIHTLGIKAWQAKYCTEAELVAWVRSELAA